jgi:hypothetical protein
MIRSLSILILLSVVTPTAQTLSSASATATPARSTSQTPSTPTQSGEKKDTKKDKKDKSKKDDKNSGSQDAIDTSRAFTERIAEDVIGRIREGLEGHSRRLMLSAFDAEKMDGYLAFEDQIDSFFSRYEAFRVQFRIANVAIEGQKGIVLVDAELEQTPVAGGTALRKRSQLRFELELGRKGWRVVDVRDRNFFS